MTTQKLSPIQEAYLTYFGLLGEVDARKADEATAQNEAMASETEIKGAETRAIQVAQKVFDKKKADAEGTRSTEMQAMNATYKKAQDATRAAEKAVTDFQAKTKEELGYAPSLPQGAAPSGVRRVNL